MNDLIKEYFSFSKGQQRAIILLLSLILIVAIFNFYLPLWIRPAQTVGDHELKDLMSQIMTENESDFDGQSLDAFSSGSTRKPSILTPFKFNPNLLDETGFKRLGLKEKLVATILNYRNKGGKFYNKESLKRIYGLHEDEYHQLESFIEIPNEYKNNFSNKPKEIISIELNSADTTQLIKLRGIGSKLSMNIIKYRELLGGFARIEQLKEVFGISNETFEQIKSSIHVNKALIRKINLNEATLSELNMHPYLRGEIARAIVDYRKAHHYKIEDLIQIKEIPLINDEIFRKIVHYLTVH